MISERLSMIFLLVAVLGGFLIFIGMIIVGNIELNKDKNCCEERMGRNIERAQIYNIEEGYIKCFYYTYENHELVSKSEVIKDCRN